MTKQPKQVSEFDPEIQKLFLENSLSTMEAVRISGLSRTTVTKILKGVPVKENTRRKLISSINRKGRATSTQGVADKITKIAEIKSIESVETEALCVLENLEGVSEFLKSLRKNLDTNKPIAKASEIHKLILECESIAKEVSLVREVITIG